MVQEDEKTKGVEGQEEERHPDEELTVVTPLSVTDVHLHKVRASLVVVKGTDIGREFTLGNEQVIGRFAGVEIPIDDLSLSRRHARILLAGKEGGDEWYEIEDLGSTNGVLVNNRKVEKARLMDGDKVRLGNVIFKFMLADQIDARFHQEITRRMNYDGHTGLLTLVPFYRFLDATLRDHRSKGRSLALLMTDLDGLKQVNDRHGHLAGAWVVRETAATMRKVLEGKAVAGLYGGDEYIAFFPGMTKADAVVHAEALRKAIEVLDLKERGVPCGVTMSLGLADFPADAADRVELVAAADRALYRAKEMGRNRVCLHGEHEG